MMSLSIKDARIFSNAMKKARKKLHLTQATCAELLNHSLSFQKDLERCRCSPSIENFYHICRTLIFPQMTVSFQKTAKKQILHTTSYSGCFRYVTKAV